MWLALFFCFCAVPSMQLSATEIERNNINRSRLDEKCSEGEDCGPGLYCEMLVRHCLRCTDCNAVNRHNPEGCIKDLDDCGPCLQGFTDVIEHFFEPAVMCRPLPKNITSKVIGSEQKQEAVNYGVIGGFVSIAAVIIVVVIGAFFFLQRRHSTRQYNEVCNTLEMGALNLSPPPSYCNIFPIEETPLCAENIREETERETKSECCRRDDDVMAPPELGGVVTDDDEDDPTYSEASTVEEDNHGSSLSLAVISEYFPRARPNIIKRPGRLCSSMSCVSRIRREQPSSFERVIRHNSAPSLLSTCFSANKRKLASTEHDLLPQEKRRRQEEEDVQSSEDNSDNVSSIISLSLSVQLRRR